ncbi:hypothetical protein SAMN05216276_1001328 [Streptosporangium subroseum]|uniref:Uncharacterized protein n=1 Tax=Streptosporangium subroseum TaxID=106412 RepID=A0A239AEE6_9ACTN|nr:hypothetical protein [Streptosporangium subroseum]SNR93742.1 hypothetical protein SAMN05216276_1001328 [Streptosporangium subroseum]
MDLVWAAVAWVVWFAAYRWAISLTDRRESPQVSPGPVPPSVLGLVRGLPARHLYLTALLDLAERGWLDVDRERVSNSAHQPEEPLRPFERWALEQVTARMAGMDEAPLEAVVPDPDHLQAEFVPLVRQSSDELGLTERRWRTRTVPVLLAVLLFVPGILTLNVVSWVVVQFFGLVGLVWAAWTVGGGAPRRRVTPAGRAFADTHSEAVTGGDQHTNAIAAALEQSGDAETWSSRGGWHRVEVDRSPAPDSPWSSALGAVLCLGVGTGVQWIDYWQARAIGGLFLVAGITALVGAVRGFRRIRRTPARAEVTGQVVSLWTHEVRTGSDPPRSRTDHYVAVDDGQSEPVPSYQVGERFYRRVRPGDSVRLLVNPRTRSLVEVISHERHS